MGIRLVVCALLSSSPSLIYYLPTVSVIFFPLDNGTAVGTSAMVWGVKHVKLDMLEGGGTIGAHGLVWRGRFLELLRTCSDLATMLT